MQTSAKENINLKEAFEAIVDVILKYCSIKDQQQKPGNSNFPQAPTKPAQNQDTASKNAAQSDQIKLGASQPKKEKSGTCC